MMPILRGLKAAEAYCMAGNVQNALSILKKLEPKFPGNMMLLKKIGLLECQLASKVTQENTLKNMRKTVKETGRSLCPLLPYTWV